MKFKINYNGDYEDSIIVKGETIEEIKTIVFAECEMRGWDQSNCWSEQIK